MYISIRILTSERRPHTICMLMQLFEIGVIHRNAIVVVHIASLMTSNVFVCQFGRSADAFVLYFKDEKVR